MRSRVQTAFAGFSAIAFAAAAPVAWADRLTLNDTGMTQCVGHRGAWSSDCTKSGQDAAHGRDVNNPNPDDGVLGFSFRKVCRSGQMAGEGNCPADPALGSGPDEWGCVFDNVTHLTWEVKTADGGLHHGQRQYTNKNAGARDNPKDVRWLIEGTNAEVLCGASDWRLPNALEMQSIVDYGMGVPGGPGGGWVDLAYFPNTLGWFSWTSEKHLHDAQFAYYVDIGRGTVDIQKRSVQSAANLVRGASRSQDAPGNVRFITSTDGLEVTDTMTGLVWRRCAEGTFWNDGGQSCDGEATEFTWEHALDYAKANREGGWRIPNVKELFSLVDPQELMSIDPLAFPNTPFYKTFISSTPVNCCNWDQVSAQSVQFGRGSVQQTEIYKHSSTFYLRLVRRGRE